MKKSELSFAEGFITNKPQEARAAGKTHRAFDWDKAAQIIKDEFANHPDLVAEAGLQGDWAHTGGCIFRGGTAINSEYTYLASNWAAPTLILSWDGEEQKEIECAIERSDRFHSHTKWDEASLQILGLPLLTED